MFKRKTAICAAGIGLLLHYSLVTLRHSHQVRHPKHFCVDVLCDWAMDSLKKPVVKYVATVQYKERHFCLHRRSAKQTTADLAHLFSCKPSRRVTNLTVLLMLLFEHFPT